MEDPKKDELALEEQQLRMTELRLKIKDLERIAGLEKSTALKTREDNLRVSELELKVSELGKSEFKRISTYTGMLAIMIALGGVIGQNILSGIKSERTLLAADTVEAKRKATVKLISQATLKLAVLNDSLKIANAQLAGGKLNVAVSNSSIDALTKIVASLPKTSISASQNKKIDSLIKTSKQSLSSQVELPPDIKTNVNPVSAAQTKTGNTAQPTSPAAVNDPDDPQKGKWGMKSEVNGRKISATVSNIAFSKYYQVVIKVESTDPAKPLTGKVQFHLHNAFAYPDPVVPVTNNEAVYYSLKALGAFTVGAEADGGATRLELDMSQLQNAPTKFRER
ncbi:MAG: hypothetical protein JWP45_656 [Mucilaginibacter sp.]|nr:hypothetical protein [Mucilaginibacter sp.]